MMGRAQFSLANVPKQDEIIASQGLMRVFLESSTELLVDVDSGGWYEAEFEYYVNVAEVLMGANGQITGKVDIRATVEDKSMFAEIHVNAAWKSRWETWSAGVTRNITFSPVQVVVGDLVQLWVKSEDNTIGQRGEWDNFKLYADQSRATYVVQ